jgi:transposase
MTRFHTVEHLPADEIDRRYKTCPSPREKTHWQVLWLLTRPNGPRTAAAVGRVVGLTPTWVRALVRRWNADGPAGLADGRKGNGPADALTPERQAALYAALQADPPDGGLWTGPKVVRFVRDRWGVEVVPQTGWRWLRGLGFALRVPRPRHPKAATPDQQRVWL